MAGFIGFSSHDLRGTKYARDHGLPHLNTHAITDSVSALPGINIDRDLPFHQELAVALTFSSS